MRVAILGGGVASLTTALELTDPAQNGRYEVTIYQLGWRLGGKCASGRDREMYNAIEEHGLHVFFGFYDNAFSMLRACYDALARDPKSPFPTLFDALEPNSNLSVLENVGGTWLPWASAVPVLPGLPGDPNPPSLWSAIVAAIQWIHGRIHELHAECGSGSGSTSAGGQGLSARLSQAAPAAQAAQQPSSIARALQVALALAEDLVGHGPDQHMSLAGLLEDAWHEFIAIFARLSTVSNDLRRRVIEADLVGANVIGILREGLLTDPQTATQKMNQHDYRDWLLSHGALQMTVDSALVRTLYDLIFAYPEGDNSQKGNVEAGSTVNTLLQMWLYRGAITYKMRAGTGDVVIAPMYQVLRQRNVRFEFFSRVTDIVPAADGTNIEQITISRQVNLLDQSYLPLFDAKGLPSWPNAPHYDQIVEGAALKAGKINLESRWSGWQDTGGTRNLVAGTDFDVAVLGISLGALPEICSKLIAQKKPWQDMIAAVKTVQTQSVQLHLDCTLAQTGWTGPPGTLAGAYDVSEMDTWADISEILAQEDWPAPAPKSQLTFCGPMKGPPVPPPAGQSDFPKQALDQVTTTTRDFLETKSAPIWPALTGSQGFDWGMLHDETGAKGPDRLAAQYLRANIDPTERYVQTLAGSSQFRLRTDQSGYDNLYLAGDWIDNPINVGAFEATVMSGKLASRAISGLPRSLMRVPSDSPYLRQRPPMRRPLPKVPFIVHGGVQTFPGPIVFDNATLWAFFVPGDMKLMTALANKFFAAPTGGKFTYVPLFPSVLLTVANIPDGSFRNSPGMGYSQEAELAAWMFLGRISPDGKQIDDVVAFCPYLFVDNPIAQTTGREVFGFLKQRGWITVTPQNDGMDRLAIEAFGTPAQGSQALWQQAPFLTLDPLRDAQGKPPQKISGLEGAVAIIQDYLTQKKDPALPSLDLLSRLYADLKSGVVHQLFMKQFRDMEYPETACYQAIATAAAKVTRSEGVRFMSNFQMSLSNLTNIPMCAELGIPPNCTTELAMKVVLDMTISPGSLLWQAKI